MTKWWKKTVELDRPQMTIWRMSTACWITRAELGICNTYWFSTATVVTLSHLSATLCVHGLLYLNTSNCTVTLLYIVTPLHVADVEKQCLSATKMRKGHCCLVYWKWKRCPNPASLFLQTLHMADNVIDSLIIMVVVVLVVVEEVVVTVTAVMLIGDIW